VARNRAAVLMLGRLLTGRMLQYLLLIVAMLVLNFMLPRMMPGTPLAFLAGEDVGLMTAEQRQAVMEQHGLDQPLPQQFGRYVVNLAQGDFGYSFQQRRPISDIIGERLPWTLLLAGANLLISTIIGVLVGAIAAWKRGGRSDASLMATFVFLAAMPSFWIGMILVAVFSAQLGWFPVYGAYSTYSGLAGWDRLVDIGHHLVLPLTSLVLISVSSVFFTMRYSMLSVLRQDYISMARAKGVPERLVKYRHAMRNALLPVLTIFMLNLGFIVSGAVVIETVFAYPGIGRLLFQAVMARDYPVLQATFLLITLTVIAANIVADLLYPLFDPRVRVGGAR
jgi:peptide/nickel transport system permease protein